MKVLIVGAGGHATVVADILLRMRDAGVDADPVGLLDDNELLHGSRVLGLPVAGRISDAASVPHDAVIVAIGDNARRHVVTGQLLEQGERFVVARHPSSIVAPDSVIGMGTMICAGAIVSPFCQVGAGVIVNTACSIDHHSRIGDYAHLGPGARLGGAVTVGRQALIGIGAIVMPSVRIGEGSTVGAGAVVTRDVEDGVTVVGTPAAPVKAGIR